MIIVIILSILALSLWLLLLSFLSSFLFSLLLLSWLLSFMYILPTGRALYEWKMGYLNNGQSLPCSSISGEAKSTSIGGMDPLLQRKYVSSIKDEGLGLGEKPDYYTMKVNR